MCTTQRSSRNSPKRDVVKHLDNQNSILNYMYEATQIGNIYLSVFSERKPFQGNVLRL